MHGEFRDISESISYILYVCYHQSGRCSDNVDASKKKRKECLSSFVALVLLTQPPHREADPGG